jgi:hypothetical protein
VGSGVRTGDGYSHALLWNGSPASVVDLHPSGFSATGAVAISPSGTQEVGEGWGGVTTDNNYHALLWSGSAASLVDLNPSGFTESHAYGTDGTHQVGKGFGPSTGNLFHALLWSGSGAGYFDLHSVLPASFTFSSAQAIDGGKIYGFAGDAAGNYHAIVWSIPEPGSLFLTCVGACAAVLCARRGFMCRSGKQRGDGNDER